MTTMDRSHNRSQATQPKDAIKTIAKKIKKMHVAMLTTLDPDGVLRSRPMGTQTAEFDGNLWFFTKEHSEKVNAINSDQHVNVSYSDNDEKKWISLAGNARIVHDREKMKELWSPRLKAWFPDGLEDPDIALICVEVESAQYWDSPSSAVVMLQGPFNQALKGRSLEQNKYSEKVEIKH